MKHTITFSKQRLAELTPDSDKRRYVYDDKVNGLCLSITPMGTKSFLVYRKLHGRPLRVTLGRFPDMTVEQARRQALGTLAKLADGKNPIAEKRKRQRIDITLQQVFDTYLTVRKDLKPRTIEDYTKSLRQTCRDWLDKPLRAITKDMVLKRHAQRGKESPARANNAFRVLRALFNFAKVHYEDEVGGSLFPDNPVDYLSATKAWFKIKGKQSYLSHSVLPKWFASVIALEQPYSFSLVSVARDYLLFLLFTGGRREEIASLHWDDVNLADKTFTLRHTKNSEVVTLPASSFALQLLNNRLVHAENDHVFPGTGATGHLINVNRHVSAVRRLSGLYFSLHDLRRTFATIAESLDISYFTLKRLINHKVNSEVDVTAGYVIANPERLRIATQRITDRILELVGYRGLDEASILDADKEPIVESD
jgi:integrase